MEERTAWWIADYADRTTLHPMGLTAALVAGFATLMVSRRNAVIPAMVLACLVARAQRIVVFGLDFDLIRILVVFGWARVLLNREYRGAKLMPADICVLCFAAAGTLAYFLTYPDVKFLITKLGQNFDVIGAYFLFRFLVRDSKDVEQLLKGTVILSIPVALAFTYEHFTRRNLFSLFGGVPEITVIRDNRLRCQGAFAHPILAGCFFASMLPMIAAWYFDRRSRRKLLFFVGATTFCLIVVLCASSTPVMSVIFAAIGWAVFRVRSLMRPIRWCTLVLLVFLHMFMEAPVWHLISRLNVVSGSTGWHRYNLINKWIENFDDWWAIGMRHTGGWGITDITNQYVLESVRGGLLALGFFVAAMTFAYRGVGRIWRVAHRNGNRSVVYLGWGLGVALFVHMMNFWAVSYFGQIVTLYYLHLALITSLEQNLTMPSASLAPAAVHQMPRKAPQMRRRPVPPAAGGAGRLSEDSVS